MNIKNKNSQSWRIRDNLNQAVHAEMEKIHKEALQEVIENEFVKRWRDGLLEF